MSGKTRISLDLGLTQSSIKWKNNKIKFPDSQLICIESLKKILDRDNVVFFISEEQIFMVATSNGGYYKLVPTEGAPTLEIDGIRMHRTKGVTPEEDTIAKLDALGEIRGLVLDTCMGLGYTAIEAYRRGASNVVTVDIQPSVLHICSMNPWSQDLFNSKVIHPIIADSFNFVEKSPHKNYDVIIHDPPRHKKAGLLYSVKFYQNLYRILRSPGKLFHYVGEPRSKFRGVNLIKGVQNRLREAGFHSLKVHKTVRGITCCK